MRCPNCDFAWETEPCPECGQDNLTEAKFCNWCGRELPHPHAAAWAPASSLERLACPDGMCIGIIGEDGLCVICGKSYNDPPAAADRDQEEATDAEEASNPAAR